MSSDTHYPHAPITEALIDFRVQYANADITLERLKGFGGLIRKEYPFMAARNIVQAEVQFDVNRPNAAASSSAKIFGYIFHSEDRKQAVQVRLDGFTFTRFMPYENWWNLKAEALRLWTLFVSEFSPRIVNRVALRYVNQIHLPLKDGTLTFNHYLRAFPKIGDEDDDVKEMVEQVFMGLVLPQDDLQARLILTEWLLPAQSPSPADSVGVILDLDLAQESASFNAESTEIWALLDRFRERKNRYFESAITEATRELFR
jgi:uncharacterized protein (TIGR04255 family)